MSKDTNGIKEATQNIADDTRELLAATADVAEEKVVEARNRLLAALDAAKDTYMVVQKKAIKTAKATDKAIHEKPYQAMGIAFGLGALVGYLIARRNSK
ncbi:MAG TPA: DUF883 family protein [Verrucomicrobiae bacterium]|jgi:ElaB/YqjD/DUF883 family membrane-anchored ribosome-binding protein|nr:DUF883 family protein [Verrucomicrobiae bacterium]